MEDKEGGLSSGLDCQMSVVWHWAGGEEPGFAAPSCSHSLIVMGVSSGAPAGVSHIRLFVINQSLLSALAILRKSSGPSSDQDAHAKRLRECREEFLGTGRRQSRGTCAAELARRTAHLAFEGKAKGTYGFIAEGQGYGRDGLARVD